MNQPALRQFIESECTRLGFSLLGVTSPEPPPHFDVYERWLSNGMHGEMDYLANDRARLRRNDPKRILANCSSILLLGIPYSPVVKLSKSDSAKKLLGRVASYAWGDDYHDVLVTRMGVLVDAIESHLARRISSRAYTDTGPILERDLAQRAGLGWIGKNTCLIHPQKGSNFFLAEILLDINLTPDVPYAVDRCGSCRRCLDACPTGCILEDRTIDSRLCISYLTIELKGAIPPQLRPLIGDWIFGCDVCQQVCPWNIRFATEEIDRAFTPRNGMPFPELIDELSLTRETFNRKFAGSPVKRAKRGGYLRNVAVALGNHRNKAAVPYLKTVMVKDHEPLVRGHAAWALGQISGDKAMRALAIAMQQETHTEVRQEINAALGAGK